MIIKLLLNTQVIWIIFIQTVPSKCTAKPYSFLVIDASLASDNPSSFRKDIKTNHDNW